jgi:hypothetical protein
MVTIEDEQEMWDYFIESKRLEYNGLCYCHGVC